MKPSELKKLLVHSFKHNYPVLIKGMPGVGKTDIVKQAAKKVEFDLMICHPVVDDPTDYKGLGAIVDGKAKFLPYGNLERMMTVEEPLVVFFDDLGQATAAVQSAVMQLLLSRTINGMPISEYVIFVAATNRRQDKANVSGILEPVKSRFVVIVELTPDLHDWIKWAIKKKIPSQLISFIQFRPDLLCDFKPTRDIENSPIPRTIANVGKLIKYKLPKTLYYESFMGAAGKAFSLEFTAFLNVYGTLPTLKEIKAKPKDAKIPDEVSGKFALIGMIVEDITNETMGAYITYLERFGSEMVTAAIKLTSVKKPEECKNVSFIQWAVKHDINFTKKVV